MCRKDNDFESVAHKRYGSNRRNIPLQEVPYVMFMSFADKVQYKSTNIARGKIILPYGCKG